MKVDQTEQTRRDEGALLHTLLLLNIASKSATIYALFVLFIIPIVSWWLARGDLLAAVD